MAARAIDFFGSRAEYAAPRDSDRAMKEKARAQGYFPQAREKTLGNQLMARLATFKKNAELGSLMARRRADNDSMKNRLQVSETLAENSDIRIPALRPGMGPAVGAERMRDEIMRGPATPPTSDGEDDVDMSPTATRLQLPLQGGPRPKPRQTAPTPAEAAAKEKAKARSQRSRSKARGSSGDVYPRDRDGSVKPGTGLQG